MKKKIAFYSVAILLILAQIVFIVTMYNGTKQEFERLYKTFSVEQTAYTKFMFSIMDWWWILPFACALLVAWTIWRWPGKLAIVVLLLDMACLCALVCSPYSTIIKMGAVV
ncbi:MAG: hypothetical protein LBB76_12600 [Azoarcus sp.]|nr:hypothetical protein [Azoarcus sp.]